MPRFAVSLTRTVREDAIVYVEAEDAMVAEAVARNEVVLGAVSFTRALGHAELDVDWVEPETTSP